MKILHIINNLGSGGAEKLIEQLVPLVNENEDFESDILLLTDKENVFEQHLRESDVNILVVPLRKPRHPLNIFFIKRFIDQGKYDVVHAHLFPTLYWVSIVSRLMSKEDKPRFVFTEHSTHNRRREKKIFRQLERIIYSSYDGVISVSDKTHENLVEWLGAENDDRFITIPNGVNVECFGNATPYKKHHINKQFTENTRLVCMVGRFTEAKDQRTLIRSMALLPAHVHLLLVGAGPLKEENECFAKDLNLVDRVHFLGFRNDVERIVKTSDIVVLSSHWEGFPIAAIEAMATGKPLIASNVQGLSEVAGNSAVLFELGNHVELARAISTLLNNVDEYDRVSRACIVRANSFDIFGMVKGYLDFYSELINSEKRPGKGIHM